MINIPFNHQPVSVAVKTASYAIPAGNYARVTVNLEGAGTFTIGGVTALRGTSNSVLASDNLRTSTNSNSQASSLSVSDTNISPTAVGTAFNETTDNKVTIAVLWLPSGTTIAGTGTWRATVELYNEIS